MAQEQFLKDQEQENNLPSSFISDDDQEDVIPKSFVADKSEKKKEGFLSIASKILDSLTSDLPKHEHKELIDNEYKKIEEKPSFLEKHPKIREVGQRILTGTSPEFEEEKKKAGITQTVGPELMKIPGSDKLSEAIREKGRNTGSYAGGFLGSLAGDVVDFASTGFDPRTAGLKESLPEPSLRKPLRSVEKSFKVSGELPFSELSLRKPREIPLDRPDLVAPGEEAAFNSNKTTEAARPTEEVLYDQARNKFNMGKELPKSFVAETAEEVPKGKAEFLALNEQNQPMYNIVEGDKRYTFTGPEELRKRGIDIPETPSDAKPMKGSEIRDKVLAERKRAINPFEKKVEELPKSFISEAEGKLGPDASKDSGQLIDDVLSGKKPSAVLEGLSEEDIAQVRASAKENGLHVTENPIAANEPIISKDPLVGKQISESLAKGDYETTGKLLGYSDKDIETFKKNIESSKTTRPVDELFNLPTRNQDNLKIISSKDRVSIDKLKDNIQKYGLKEPIELHLNRDGSLDISNGRHRIIALKELGIESAPVKYRDSTTGALIETKRLESLPPGVDPSGMTELHGGIGGIGKGKKALDPNTGPYASALDKLFNSMGTIMEKRVEQDLINRTERARRFAGFANVQEEGVSGAKKSLSALKGEFEKVDLDKLGIPRKELNTLFTAVKRANITNPEKARGYTALFKLINGEGVPQRNELAILNEVFGNGFADKITEMHGGIGAVGLKLAKTANTMKAMRSSLDFSAPLRQGIGLIHRAEYREAFTEMFKYFAKPEYFKEAMQEIETRPNYLLGRESGLFLAKHESMVAGEEVFMNNYLGSLPKNLQLPFDASERAYTGFLNKLRADTFDTLIKNAKAAGAEPFIVNETGKMIPTEVGKNIAKYVNVSTGRGSLGRAEKYASDLNTIIWSPRLISSRLSILNPKYYTNMDAFTRKEAIKSLFAIAAAGTTITALGDLAGGKTSFNPLSSDFGKSRIGNNVLDSWAGFQQPIVAASRLIKGSNASKPQSRWTTIGNFGANKLSPFASLAYEVANAQSFSGGGNFKDKYGNKKYIPTEIMNSFVPMFMQDVTDVFKNDPSFSEQVGLDTASLFGVGVQNYPENASKPLKMRGLGVLKP